MKERLHGFYPILVLFLFVAACTKPPSDLVENGKSYARLVQLVNIQYQTETMVDTEFSQEEYIKLMEELDIHSIIREQEYIWFRGKDGMSSRTSYYYFSGHGEFEPPFGEITKEEVKLSNDDQSGLPGKWYRVVDDPF